MTPQEVLKKAQAKHDEKVALIVAEVIEKYTIKAAYQGGTSHQIEIGSYFKHLALAVIKKLQDEGWNVETEILIGDNKEGTETKARETIIVLQPEVSSLV